MNITEIQLCSPGPNYTSVMFNTDTYENDYIIHAILPVKNVNPNAPYVLRNATGLDAEEIVQTFNDGPQMFRVKPKERNVSLQIKLNPDYSGGATIGDLRDSIYKTISFNTPGTQQSVYGDRLPNKLLELRFMNGKNYIASLWGTMTKLEANLFADQPDLILNISCSDPFLYSTIRQHSNDHINNAYTGSHVVVETTYNVDARFAVSDPRSTAPHGFYFIATCHTVPPSDSVDPCKIIIWDERDIKNYLFSAAFNFQVGDQVHFNSNDADRNLFVVRKISGVDHFYTLMTSIYWGSIWPLLYPGENAYQVSEGFDVGSISHSPTYWGV